MQEENGLIPNKAYLGRAVEIAIRIALIAFTIWWCVGILAPFISIMIWAIIIAVALYPTFRRLSRALGGRKKISAILITAVLLFIIIIPSVLCVSSLTQGVTHIKESIASGSSIIPPPGDKIKSWPKVAKPIGDAWRLASQSLDSAVSKYRPQVRAAGLWFFAALSGIGWGIIQLIASTIIAGILLVYAEEGNNTTVKLFNRIAGRNGEKFAGLSKVTIIQVVKGILGVAIIQALMAAIGFLVAGIPAAGLLTVVCLILFIVQVGPALVIIPSIIYMFSVAATVPATIYAIWMTIALLSGNVLTPIMLGRNAPVPMMVIFLGAIGGFISMGFIGLFLGAVILSVAYKLYLFWLTEESS